jgi:hypothetical protein
MVLNFGPKYAKFAKRTKTKKAALFAQGRFSTWFNQDYLSK